MISLHRESTATIMSELCVDRKSALKIRSLTKTSACIAHLALNQIERLMQASDRGYCAHGVEYARSEHDTNYAAGLSYINVGDSYATTVIYDNAKKKYYLASLGDLIESGKYDHIV